MAERDVYRLDEAFHRMAAGDIDGDRENELVLLNNEELQAFRLQWGRLQPVAGYRLPSVDMVGLHIDATDVNGDGRAEILVSLLKDSTSDQTDTRLASMILTFDGTAFQVLARDLPFYLKVMEDRCGEPVLLGQKKGKHEPFEGEIVVFLWDARKGGFDHSSEYQPAHNVHSLHQFNLIPSDDQRIAILEPDGTLNVYCTPSEKVESSVGRNYGELKEIPFRIQLPGERYPGGFTRQTFGTSFVPVRFEYKESFDDQMFLIDKGRTGGLRVGQVGRPWEYPEGGRQHRCGQVVRQDPARNLERSPALGKDIPDFAFHFHGGRTQLMALTRDNLGHAIEVVQ